jgi:hypothetical protein
VFQLDRVSTRVIGAVAIATMVGGTAVGADAATKKKHRHKPIIRTVKMTYQGGCGVTARASGNGPSATPGQCVAGETYNLALKPGERYISLKVADDHSSDVPAVLWLNDEVPTKSQDFCTSLKNFPAAGISPRLDLFDGVDTDCPGSATTGTITVTFSSNPIR